MLTNLYKPRAYIQDFTVCLTIGANFDYLKGRNIYENLFSRFFFWHFTGINFREFGFTEDFVGINIRDLSLTKDFAGINFRESALFKDFGDLSLWFWEQSQ